MVEISSSVNHEHLKGDIEKFFPDMMKVYVITDYRRLEPRMLDQYSRAVTEVFIVDRAVADSFVNGRYETIPSYKINGEIFSFTQPISAIEIDSMENQPEGFKILRDDDNRLVAERKGNCILLPISIEQISSSLFNKILSLLGFTKMTEEEYFTKILMKLTMAGMEGSLKDSEKRREQSQSQMHENFNNYIQHYKSYNIFSRQLEGMKKFDTEKQKNILEQVKRLTKCKYIDSMEINVDNITIVTKPLTLSLWNIGQYKLQYKMNTPMPSITRLSMPIVSSRVMVESWEGAEEIDGIQGFHINSSGSPCSGNYSEMLKAFWMQDMLTGFNSAIKFIKSYSKVSGPYVEYEKLLATFGYYKDSKILIEKGKVKEVDNGVIYMWNKPEVPTTIDELKSWGLTGKKDNPKEIEEMIVKSTMGVNNHLTYSIQFEDRTV